MSECGNVGRREKDSEGGSEGVWEEGKEGER